MNIFFYGLNCFKLQGKDVSLILDPFDKSIGLKFPTGTVDVVTVSKNERYYNNYEDVKSDCFVIDGPGEYEIKKTMISGIESKDSNVIYKIVLEDIKICHLGALSQKSLETEQLSRLGNIDILFVPIGGQGVIALKEAENVISQIEPRIVIPMHYGVEGVEGEVGNLDDLNSFSHAHGINSDKISKFTVKEKDLPQEDTQYVIMDLYK